MPPRSLAREKSSSSMKEEGTASSSDSAVIIEKQQEYIELLEQELKSLKQHFDRTMEKIFSNPVFASLRMNGGSSSSSTTRGTTNEKKKRTRDKSREEESEVSGSDESSGEEQQQETSLRKPRQKKSSLMDLESDEETTVDNIFQMDFWNQQVSRMIKTKKSKLPKVPTPKEGSKFTIGIVEAKKTKKAAVKKPSETENEQEEMIEALPLPYFQAPVTVSESLAKLLGDSKQRNFKKDEVYKLVWQYMHKNNRFDEQHHVLLNDDLKLALHIEDSKKAPLSIDDLNYFVMRQIVNDSISKNTIASFQIKN
ncbi:hypothetical protein C9374_006274 [Naegleria lovaniensis]|uniref:DM2 domain-containing protein n=1 Tax=Naegleria lovaniensis TaxID=51637 RepID=A0AA88GNQ0_NAELO|nr:uncharacterized protein C9374_006274 [Naegleria lovaniensis]KAG2381285.1 hypothetical protein C9374_006274 [Naegleria lovaniensis]